jgi:hypothetical protein
VTAGRRNVETLQVLRALEEGTTDRQAAVAAVRVELLDLIDQLSDARSLLACLLDDATQPADSVQALAQAFEHRAAARAHLDAALGTVWP